MGNVPPASAGSAARSRRPLPAERKSITHAFSIGNHKGRVIASCYPDGRPGEVFIAMSKEGSTIGGLLAALGAAVSIGLQHGAPLAAYTQHMKRMRFEPDGWTGKLGFAHSIVDYVFRWLEVQFGPGEELAGGTPADVPASETCLVCAAPQTWGPGEACRDCGALAPPAPGRR